MALRMQARKYINVIELLSVEFVTFRAEHI